MTLFVQKIGIDAVNAELEDMHVHGWERSASFLIEWLSDQAKKRPETYTVERVSRFSDDIKHMCRSMRVEYSGGNFVVKVNGAAELTFRKLKLGTKWFAPCADLETIIMTGLDSQFGS